MATVPISFSSPLYLCFFDNLSLKRSYLGSRYLLPSIKFTPNKLKSKFSTGKSSLGGELWEKDSNFLRKGKNKLQIERLLGNSVRNGKKNERVIFGRANRGFNFGNGRGGWDKGTTTRLVGNLALAAGLTYLTVTGQLGWVLDAIVSIWLLAVILPVVGIAAFFWFVGQDIVQSTCPNCGNDFQIFKSSMSDGPQLCPFCSQPFSVKGDKFVRESARFSSERPTNFAQQAFNGFSARANKGKANSPTIVDIEAEVKDAD